MLVSPSQPAFIKNGRPPESIHHRVVKSDVDGRFAFPPQEPPYTLLVLHDRGFVQQTIDAKTSSAFDLATRPWGRVEGTFRVGSRPGAGQQVSLSYTKASDTAKAIPWWDSEATTDAEGRFTFERALPGETYVARDISVKTTPMSGRTYRSPAVLVDVVPGATTRVSLGGTGRPVVGKLTAPAGIDGPIDWAQSFNSMMIKPTVGNMVAGTIQKLSGRGAVPAEGPRGEPTPRCSTRTDRSASKMWHPAPMTSTS